MLRLLSIQVGLPRTLGTTGAEDPMDREWTTGFFKETIPGPVHLHPLGLEGDGQADLQNHGGPDKAVNAYPAAHYPGWEIELARTLPPGAFGENFTTSGPDESEICIGDIFRLGPALLQVSQPRQPCWKLARRWRVKDLAARVERNGRTGWYFRVLQPGLVSAPAELALVHRPRPEWTIAAANLVMHHRKNDTAAARALAACPELSASWQSALARRAAQGQ